MEKAVAEMLHGTGSCPKCGDLEDFQITFSDRSAHCGTCQHVWNVDSRRLIGWFEGSVLQLFAGDNVVGFKSLEANA